MDTIFALASAPGKAGVAVIRLSGPRAFPVAGVVTKSAMSGRGMWLRTIVDYQGNPLDDALVLGFVGPHSFTGEDVVEFQVHGSVAGVQSVLTELGRQDGCRLAEPGEFTRRALENGRMDLAQVEGLADLIDSETEAQRRQAHRLLSGELGAVADVWREKLVRAASLLEVTIDFADEDVPVDVSEEVSQILSEVQKDLEVQRDGVRIAERIRTGFEVAIVGPPNVGKSTLLNRLAGRQAALTSDVAGTTRDVIEVRMDLEGLPVTLLDTAGLRETEDKIESMGIDLAVKRAMEADLRVILQLPGQSPEMDPGPGDIVIVGKSDLAADIDGVSGLTGQGVDNLVDQISRQLKGKTSSAGLATRERHREALDRAANGISAARGVLSSGPDLYDVAAEELRFAIRSLEVLVGRIDVESLLDEIFSSFCLGK